MPNLHVIVASVRPTRAGWPVAQWFVDAAARHGGFTVRLVDLKEINLPLFAEPRHPRFGNYEFEHTKAWSKVVAEADAFVFVTPEYNFSTPPALANALDHLYAEWHYKPAAFVSYGGVSGGTRGVQMTRLAVAALKMMPIPEAVHIPFVTKSIQDGRFNAGDVQEQAARTMLDELLRWTNAMRVLRS